jgi:hypothetical protein
MACGLVPGQLGDSRVLLRDVSMRRGELSMHFMKDSPLRLIVLAIVKKLSELMFAYSSLS